MDILLRFETKKESDDFIEKFSMLSKLTENQDFKKIVDNWELNVNDPTATYGVFINNSIVSYGNYDTQMLKYSESVNTTKYSIVLAMINNRKEIKRVIKSRLVQNKYENK